MVVFPSGAQTIGDVLEDDPIGPVSFEGLEHLIEPLDAAFSAGKGTFLLEAWAGRKNNVGEAAGRAEKDVLNYEEIQFLECGGDVVRVGVNDLHFFAAQINRPQLARVDGIDHFVAVEAFGRRKRHAPRDLETRANFGIVHRLVARQQIRRGAVVTGALHVVVTGEWVSARAGTHIVAGYEQQVRNCGRSIRTIRVLGYAHGPKDADTSGSSDAFRHSLQRVPGNAARLRRELNSERIEALSIFRQVIDPLAQELFMLETVVQDVANHCREPY